MRFGRYESSEGNNLGTAVTFFLVGLGAGALVALALAPKTGKQFRRDLKRGYDDAKDTLQDWSEEAKDRVARRQGTGARRGRARRRTGGRPARRGTREGGTAAAGCQSRVEECLARLLEASSASSKPLKDGGEKPADPPQHAMVFGVLRSRWALAAVVLRFRGGRAGLEVPSLAALQPRP